VAVQFISGKFTVAGHSISVGIARDHLGRIAINTSLGGPKFYVDSVDSINVSHNPVLYASVVSQIFHFKGSVQIGNSGQTLEQVVAFGTDVTFEAHYKLGGTTISLDGQSYSVNIGPGTPTAGYNVNLGTGVILGNIPSPIDALKFAAALLHINIKDVIYAPTRGPRCFPGDTPILMADGATKPIHAINLGDWIMALDPAQPFAGLVPRQVTRLFRNTTDTWLKLTFLDGGTLSATPGHEMLAADGRFARLDQLVNWQADGTGRVTLVGENGELRPARAETIRFSAATAHLYPLADAAALAQGHQTAPNTFGNLALPPVHRDTQRYVIAPQ
jgi:hypothetical protein